MDERKYQKIILIGKQGVGKTTLVKRILGLLPRDVTYSGFLIQLDKTRSKRIKGLRLLVYDYRKKQADIPIARIKRGIEPPKRLPLNFDQYEFESVLLENALSNLLNRNYSSSHLLVIDEIGPLLDFLSLTGLKEAMLEKLKDDLTFVLLIVDNAYRDQVLQEIDSSKSIVFNLSRGNHNKIRERVLMAIYGYHNSHQKQNLTEWKQKLQSWFKIQDQEIISPSLPKIILQGPPRVGKTTVIEKFLQRYGKDFKMRGFYTKEMRDIDKRRVGFEARLISGDNAILAHVAISGPKVSRYGVDLSVINDLLIPAINSPYERNELIIVDEIGKMELMSPFFQEIIIKVLDNPDAFVLATMRDPPTPFMKRLLRNKYVVVVPVTPVNRDSLPVELAEVLNGFLISD